MREREKKKSSIDNHRWPLPYILFILQDSCTLVSVESAYPTNRYPTLSVSLSISLFVRTTLPCVAFRDPLERVKRADERVNTRECVRASQSVSLTPRRAVATSVVSFLLRETIGYSATSRPCHADWKLKKRSISVVHRELFVNLRFDKCFRFVRIHPSSLLFFFRSLTISKNRNI